MLNFAKFLHIFVQNKIVTKLIAKTTFCWKKKKKPIIIVWYRIIIRISGNRTNYTQFTNLKKPLLEWFNKSMCSFYNFHKYLSIQIHICTLYVQSVKVFGNTKNHSWLGKDVWGTRKPTGFCGLKILNTFENFLK